VYRRVDVRCFPFPSILDAQEFTWQPLGPLLKVKLLVGYIENPTKLKGAKGIRLI